MTAGINISDKVAFIWSIADLLRGPYKPHQYGRVIIPMTVLRRLDCVLESTKPAVLKEAAKLKANSPIERPHCKIFDNEFFGYHKITVERPLRLNFQASAERIERLHNKSAFKKLAESKKKSSAEKAAQEHAGREAQATLITMLEAMPDTLYRDRPAFLDALATAARTAHVALDAPLRRAILSALSVRDDAAEVCADAKGNPEPDTSLRDTESVPLSDDIAAYVEREVKPYAPDAWVDEAKTKVGYEINFNRYFYVYTPPRPLSEIEADLEASEKRILGLLGRVRKK